MTPYSIDDLRCIFEMVGTYGIAILELPGGLKVVKAPDTAPSLKVRSEVVENTSPQNIAEDPFLYPDGEVPSFRRS